MRAINRLFVLLVAALVLTPLVRAEEGKSQTTDSGLSYTILEKGREEPPPVVGDRVTFHYVTTLGDGSEIGNSRKRDRPLAVELSEKWLVPGLLEGMQLMAPGARIRFAIPWKLAYGEAGKRKRSGDGWVVPPKTDLVYDVELVEVVRRPAFVRDGADDDYKELAPGLRMRVLREGTGSAARGKQRVRWRYAIWNQDQELVQSTFHDAKHIDGCADKLRLADRGPGERFIPVAMPHLKLGGRYWFEVAPAMGYGSEAPAHKLLPAGTRTWWEIEVVEFGEMPTFERSAPENQKTTPSGLRYEVLREGTGPRVRWGRSTEVHYVGWLLNGRRFDTSFERGAAFRSKLTGVIDGWKEGIPLMREGSIYRFEIPPGLAYGAQRKNNIPPNSTLIFWVEVTKVW